MSDNSAIEWTDASWNPIRGCSKISAGCENCYAMHVAARLNGPGKPYEGLAKRKPVNWTGDIVLVEPHLCKPLKWRKPRRVFVNSMSDLFHEKVPDEWIDRIFAVMALCPQHTFQILTKRPERMRRYVNTGFVLNRVLDAKVKLTPTRGCWSWPTWREAMKNVWLGVSVEDQATADARIPLLLQTPAAVRFVSYEPALGPVDFRIWLQRCPGGAEYGRGLSRTVVHAGGCCQDHSQIDWLIVGGESGHNARPCAVAWIRSAVAQCQAAGVACFVKQLGSRPFDPQARLTDDECLDSMVARYHDRVHDPKGGDPSEWPEDLRVREYPA